MTLSSLAPLDLLKALQAPATPARNPIATQLEQWLASELPELPAAVADLHAEAMAASTHRAGFDHFLSRDAHIVPPAGEKIPDSGQSNSGQSEPRQ